MAELLHWDPAKLSVHVDAMDREHQGLISLMNRLYDRHNANASASELESVLNELGAATIKHFKGEEQYMESVKFPGIATHRMIHQDLLKSFTQHATQFKATRKLNDAFFQFLRMWLQAHIQGIDRKYGEHSSPARKSA